MSDKDLGGPSPAAVVFAGSIDRGYRQAHAGTVGYDASWAGRDHRSCFSASVTNDLSSHWRPR